MKTNAKGLINCWMIQSVL